MTTIGPEVLGWLIFRLAQVVGGGFWFGLGVKLWAATLFEDATFEDAVLTVRAREWSLDPCTVYWSYLKNQDAHCGTNPNTPK